MHVFRKACLEASLGYPAVYPRELIEGRSNACLGKMSVSRLHQPMGVAVTRLAMLVLGNRYDVCI